MTSRIASSVGRFEVVPEHLIRLVSKHFRTPLLDCPGHPVLDRLLKRIYECVWVCVCEYVEAKEIWKFLIAPQCAALSGPVARSPGTPGTAHRVCVCVCVCVQP